ncbi:hypothetical protein G6F37_005106 [Rhizopus arrhizus]|nr:hypothetical protein G6F38_006015 [Rhizopus arrhizus]KAG1159215.1 hypothetical protein G6F37_005106 [Rhizopus arrhizus]
MNSPTCQALKFIDERQAVEEKYFKDITCCGERIATLHNLMEHHERLHDLADFRESGVEGEDFTNTMRYQDVFLPVHNQTTPISLYEARVPSLRYFTNTQECPAIDTNLLLQPSTNKMTSCSDLRPVFDFVQRHPNARPVVTCIKEVYTEQSKEIGKRYSCREPDCNKVYKNLNGLRYHQTHGHHDGHQSLRPHICSMCGKSYKASNGLRYHIEHMHTLVI